MRSRRENRIFRQTAQKDRLYVWRATEVSFSNQQLYKVGLTTKNRRHERVDETSEHSGLRAQLIFDVSVNPDYARQLESDLLKIGRVAKTGKSSGSSEFRWLTGENFRKLERTMRAHPGTVRVFKPNTVFNDYESEANILMLSAQKMRESAPRKTDNVLISATISLALALFLAGFFGLVTLLLIPVIVAFLVAQNIETRKRDFRDSEQLTREANQLILNHKQRARELCDFGESVNEPRFKVRNTLWEICSQAERESESESESESEKNNRAS